MSDVALRLPFSPAARLQFGIFLLAYLVYSAARYITVGDLSSAQAHAEWIVDLERTLGVYTEAAVQHALSGTPAIWILNHLYLAAQLVVLPGSLIWLYHRSRPTLRAPAQHVLATWLISIPVYAAFPVAPPRLAHLGLIDTITSQSGFSMDSSLTTSFYNQLAAVPSLHVGFAVAIGIAVASVMRNPVAKGLALLWGPTIGLAVVATGNHFVFDIVAGVAASALGYAFGLLALRPRRRWGLAPAPRRRREQRRPPPAPPASPGRRR
jgi:membrane-associated phospholipid phosphatase